MFLAKGKYRDCELDDYENGCIPNSGYSIKWDVSFQGRTMEKLLKEIKEYHGIDEDAIEIESGKIFIQVQEIPLYDRWITPTKDQITAWKNGNQEIYLVDYVYQIYQEI
ncbi:MAG TPA: hypothetical protein GX708_01850 [Gallicola sp.]|nr:hypothetical protein [Gallicola sp.]